MTVLDLSAYEGQVIRIRFYFNTCDGVANDYPGWFFDDVMVMAEDERLRANRLGLLAAVAALFRSVADFSKMYALQHQ